MRLLAFLILSFAIPGFALAQSTPDAEFCAGSAGTVDDRIAACSRAITSGKLSTQNLAITFYNRGRGWSAKGDTDRAIADFSEAIRLNPQHAKAFNNRGNRWADKGDNDRAIADYNEAIRLNPQDANTFNNRGVAQYCQGLFDAAAADFAQGMRLDAKDADSLIWRSLSLFRSGKAELARSELQHASQTFTKGEWPEPVMELLSGQINPPALLKTAENPDAKKSKDQMCKAHFYLGEYHLLNNRPSEARTLLQNAEQECPKDFIEYNAAVAELKRMSH
jgi:lipoprotein NlpI